MINNFGTTDYVRDTEDLAAYKAQNPSETKPANVEKTSGVPTTGEKPKADSFSSVNNKVLSTKEPQQYIKSNLQIDIKDKDGFANFGKADIRAKVSGDVSLTKDFIMSQLTTMLKDGPEKKFNPPRFDADRKQFIISGTAKNALLGMINIPFEIRLGEKEGKLCFLVDNALTRGSIYSDLKDMMHDAGIVTDEKDGTLYIKHSLGQTIDLPLSKDKNHVGRVEWIDSNTDNTKASIDKFGNVSVKLKDVQMIASTDIGTVNAKVAKPDVASIKFDFSMNSDMKPQATFQDGSVNANVEQKDLEKYMGKENLKFVEQTFGTALSLNITGLGGNLKVNDKGVSLETSANIASQAKDSDAKASTQVKVQLEDSKPVIEANNISAKLKGDQKINAQQVSYDGRKEGVNVTAKNLDANVSVEGISAQVKGSGDFKQDKQGNIQAGFDGQSKGNIKKDNIDLNFSSSGSHTVGMKDKNIEVKVDQAGVTGSYDLTKQPPSTASGKPSENKINIEVKQVSADANVKTSVADINAQVKNGGLKVTVDENINISTDTDIKAKATGETLNGVVSTKGVDVKIKDDGNINITANNTKADARFRTDNNRIKVGGKVAGDVAVNIDKQGTVDVQTTKGSFDADFKLRDKVAVKGKGGDAHFNMNQNEDVHLKLNNIDAKTDVKISKVQVSAHTKGESVSVDAVGDDVSVVSNKTRSQTSISVNKHVFNGKGDVGDINLKIHSTETSDAVDLGIKDANFKGNIRNTSGRLNVGVGTTKADIKVIVDEKEDVRISSKNAKLTDAHVELVGAANGKKKIDVVAQGKDFAVDVVGDDIDINLKKVQYGGKITPKDGLAIDANSTAKSDIKLKIVDKPDYTDVNVSAKAPVAGSVSVGNQVNTNFSNKEGFNLFIKDSDESTHVKTGLKDLAIDGKVDVGVGKIGVNGLGNFDFDLVDKPLTTDLDINYDGHLQGDASAKLGEITGKYKLQGKTNVKVADDDINVKVNGKIDASLNSGQYGAGANINAEGSEKNPLSVSINTKNATTVGVGIEQGFVEITDIDKLKLGQVDPTVNTIISKLKSKSSKVVYKDLQVANNGEKISGTVQAKKIETAYGNIGVEVKLKKEGNIVEAEKGSIELQPNDHLFKFIQEELSKKFKIKITGQPELKNGNFKIQGEVQSKNGVVQLADFDIKTRVVDNNLEFDLERANVLKVIGASTLNTVLNKVLNRTDIEHFKIDKKSTTVKLADIVKDLSLTQGVNFTGIVLKDDKILVDFYFSNVDRKIAEFDLKKDPAGLAKYLETVDLSTVSGEGISTAFNTFTQAKDVDNASKLLAKVVTTYSSTDNKKELDRGLAWVSKDQTAKGKYIKDNITLEFTKIIKLGTSEGDKLVKALPTSVVSSLAGTLDATLSQKFGNKKTITYTIKFRVKLRDCFDEYISQ
jgi:hypothetical protein